MPELPEVQTVINSLQNLKNKKIINFSYSWERVIYNAQPDKLNDIIKNEVIMDLSRRGKYIIIHLKKYYLAFHLRMTGYLYQTNKIPINSKYIRCSFALSSNQFLIFEDIRKFGGFYLFKHLSDLNKKIGIDPFDRNFTISWMKKNMSKKNRMIKHLLLDQQFICGLGNIYTDEILWKSKIHPRTISCNIKNINILHLNILATLNESIEFHGTTFMNFKFDNMKTGNYKAKLNVYGRKNLPCKRCKNIIIKTHIAGRGTYICTYCQK